MSTTLKQVLTIAGSDSGGGAGIQADIKAMSANGVFAMSVITAITAQNTEEVTEVFELPTSIIAAQIDAVFDDFEVAAVKTGMLSSTAIVETVARMLKPQEVPNLVVDPVMISKSGHSLLKPDAIEAVKHRLFPLALLVTPNVREAQQLSGIEIKTLADARRAAKVIHGFGCKHVLIKGGHMLAERATDLLYDEAMKNIVTLKLGKIQRRIRENHKIELTYSPEVVGEVAKRCTEVESGARNVDNILTNTMLPDISRYLLSRMAENQKPTTIRVSVAENGAFVYA